MCLAAHTLHMGNQTKRALCHAALQTWRYLVLDEGHRVRNEDTLTVKALRAVRRGNVLLLTGAHSRAGSAALVW